MPVDGATSGRSGHSATLIGDKICVYGGRRFVKGVPDVVSPINPIALLDTTTLTWSVPLLEDPNIPKLVYHSATLIDKLMLIAFGM